MGFIFAFWLAKTSNSCGTKYSRYGDRSIQYKLKNFRSYPRSIILPDKAEVEGWLYNVRQVQVPWALDFPRHVYSLWVLQQSARSPHFVPTVLIMKEFLFTLVHLTFTMSTCK
ncbi:hypothetical protein CDAR_207191 [Caerostris darwini]|uniref:Uncharacterized protein n=1 Tax=Caerostris darwini TaxID=1538125 RepID=A0AAV4SPE9_9ARAC|nr:hypothetical protein CDAR_207191 [Caerostris darwini]